MASYLNNYFAAAEQSVVARPDVGMASFVAMPWANCPMYGPGGVAELLNIGGNFYDHVAPGFEYALDAPIRIPAGSMRAVVAQPYWD